MTNDTQDFANQITYPLPPMNTPSSRFDMEVYAKFMRHLRELPMESDEMKILSAILFTAKAMGTSNALISKVLVDMGLRAERRAFPMSFLEFVDEAIAKAGFREGAASSSVIELADSWRSSEIPTFAHIDDIVGVVRTQAEQRYYDRTK